MAESQKDTERYLAHFGITTNNATGREKGPFTGKGGRGGGGLSSLDSSSDVNTRQVMRTLAAAANIVFGKKNPASVPDDHQPVKTLPPPNIPTV